MTLERPPAVWLRWALPSFADLFFLVLIGMLAFSPMSAGLLRDADTGWHIRSGEQILATHAIPRTDPFSYTQHGEPWYAWEWMYDVVIAAIHHVSGLNGVVLFTAAVIGLTFALSVSIHSAAERKPGSGRVSDAIGDSGCPGSYARQAARSELAVNTALGRESMPL